MGVLTLARWELHPHGQPPKLLANFLNIDANENTAYTLNLEYDEVNPNVYEIVIVNYEPQQHPMHFHGYSVYIVGYGYWTTPSGEYGWTEKTWKKGWWEKKFDSNGNFIYDANVHGLPEFDKPVQNVGQVDSFTVPPRGFVVVRLKADNPGAWYCKFNFHRLLFLYNILHLSLSALSYGTSHGCQYDSCNKCRRQEGRHET